MREVRYLRLGALLMLLLGLARGLGGMMLMVGSAKPDPKIRAGGTEIVATAAALMLLGLALAVTSAGVFRRQRMAWLVGAVLTVAFVLGGVVNGIVLYGRPQVAGTLGNLVVAAAIILCLWRGRPALGEDE